MKMKTRFSLAALILLPMLFAVGLIAVNRHVISGRSNSGEDQDFIVSVGDEGSTEAAIRSIERIARLEPDVTRFQLKGATITDEAMRAAEPLRHVEFLELHSTAVTSDGLRSIGKWRQLRSLFLNDNPINDAGLIALKSMPNLERLELANTRITGDGFKALRALQRMRHLDVRYTPLGDHALSHIAKWPTLETLYLEGTEVTDRGMAHVSQISSLTALSLVNTEVTDRGLQHLRRLKNLQRLEIQGTGCTSEGAESLRSSLPYIFVDIAEPDITEQEPVYNRDADASNELETAVEKARETNKRVLVQFGANWCIWCYKLRDAMAKHEMTAKLLEESYVPVYVDVGDDFERNMDIRKRLGADIETHGVPYLIILASDGIVLARQESSSLERGQFHDPERIETFLRRWRPKATSD